jgi:hypothetical protein
MGAGAVFLSMLTVLVGMAALSHVVTDRAPSSLRTLVVGHVSFAFGGILLLLVAVVGASSGIAWTSFGVLVATGLLGATVLLRAPRVHPAAPAGADKDVVPDVGPVPVAVVVLHGAAAVGTILLVLLTAAGASRI